MVLTSVGLRNQLFLEVTLRFFLNFERFFFQDKDKITVLREKNQQDATIRCLLLTSVSTCFGHHYAHLQENKEIVTAFGVLFCNKRKNVYISRDVFFCGAVCSKSSWDFVCVCECHV